MADDPSAADRNVEIWKIKKLIKSLEAARGWALRPAPPCPLGTRTSQDGRPRAAWPDEGSQALANSRLLDLWIVALYPGARVNAVGWRRGPSPEGVHSRGSDRSTPSTPSWQATVTSVPTPSKPLNPTRPSSSSRYYHPTRVLLGGRARPSFPNALPWFPLFPSFHVP